ncbi:MAG: DUF4347 domain-containing protein [Gammaproteobacteria bacterium]|nr:DUF4347 domain-containing protein [Gammaproteobacteria bacterium]
MPRLRQSLFARSRLRKHSRQGNPMVLSDVTRMLRRVAGGGEVLRQDTGLEHSQVLFEALEPRILLSADGFMPPPSPDTFDDNPQAEEVDLPPSEMDEEVADKLPEEEVDTLNPAESADGSNDSSGEQGDGDDTSGDQETQAAGGESGSGDAQGADGSETGQDDEDGESALGDSGENGGDAFVESVAITDADKAEAGSYSISFGEESSYQVFDESGEQVAGGTLDPDNPVIELDGLTLTIGGEPASDSTLDFTWSGPDTTDSDGQDESSSQDTDDSLGDGSVEEPQNLQPDSHTESGNSQEAGGDDEVREAATQDAAGGGETGRNVQVVFVDSAVKEYKTLIDDIAGETTEEKSEDDGETAAIGTESDDNPLEETDSSENEPLSGSANADEVGQSQQESFTTLDSELSTQPAPTRSLSSGDSDIHVYVLESDQDGIDQISRVLDGYEGVETVHILSHGSAGALALGSTRVNAGNLKEVEQELEGWGESLAEGGDIQLYGCDVAEGEQGAKFIQDFSDFTGADVAASVDDTGAAAAGGDWELEYTTGVVESTVINDSLAASKYTFLMDAPTIDDSDSSNVKVNGSSGADHWQISGSGTTLTIGSTGGGTPFADETVTVDVGGTLAIDLGDGADSLTFNSDLTNLDFTLIARADSIDVTANIDVGSHGLSLEAEAEGSVGGANDIVSLNASVTVSNGATLAGDNVTLSATSDVSGSVSTTGLNTIDTSITSLASVSLTGGATINADGTATLTATTTGNVALESELSVTNVVEDTATVTIDGSEVNADSITVKAVADTTYAVTSPFNTQTITGDVSVNVTNGTLDATDGGVVVEAIDRIEVRTQTGNFAVDLTGLTSDKYDLNILRSVNDIDRDVSATTIDGSDLDASGGDIELSAERDATLVAGAGYTTFNGAADSSVTKISGGSNFAHNSITGDIQAYIEGSTADTAGSGDINVKAEDTAAIDATVHGGAAVDVSAEDRGLKILKGTKANAAAISVAMNSMGWVAGDLIEEVPEVENLLNILLGDSVIGTEDPTDVRAYIADSEVIAAGAVGVTALSTAQINSTVSNAVTSTSSSLFKGRSLGASGLFSGNKINSEVNAFIAEEAFEYTSADGERPVEPGDRVRLESSEAVYEYTGTADKIDLADSEQNYSSNTTDWSLLAPDGTPTEVEARGGAVTVQAGDESGIYANTKMVSSAITTSDGGANVLNDLIAAPADATHNTDGTSETVDLVSGHTVYLQDGFTGNTSSGQGADGRVYEYMGPDTDSVDIGNEDFTDPGLWKEISTEARHATDGNSETVDLVFGDTVYLNDGFNDTTTSGKGQDGRVYEYMGAGTDSVPDPVDIGNEDFTDSNLWKETTETQLVPEGNNVTPSDATAIGASAVLNDVRGHVEGYIDDATVTAEGDDGEGTGIGVSALDTGIIRATNDSSTTASGGSAYGTGTVVAGGGTVATNVVQGSARAYIEDGTITSDAPGADIEIDAGNTAAIEAETLQATTTGDTAASVILAFNTIGWQSQNVLFNSIDALLGTEIGDPNPALSEAFIRDSGVNSSGDITLTALNEAEIDSRISNASTATASAMIGASASNYAGILASNAVNSGAKAFIDNSGAPGGTLIEADGTVSLLASDGARIDAFTELQSPTSSVNDAGIGLLNTLVNTLKNDYQYTTSSGTRTLDFGDKVLVDEFAPGDYDYEAGIDDPDVIQRGDVVKVAPGEVYQYTDAVNLYDPDLSAQDYGSDAWQRQHAIYEYMGGDTPSMDLGTLQFAGVADPDDATDLDNKDFWRLVNQENVIPGAIAPTLLKATGIDGAGGGTTALSGLAARNDVRSDVRAYIRGAEVAAHEGDVSVTALEEAEIKARDRSVVTSTVGDATAAVIVTNLVLSHADAFIEDSTVTAMGGDVQVDAHNRSIIDAVARGSVSGKETIGATLAFNTIGWHAQDLLTQGIDALIGAPHIAEADDPDYTLLADGATLQDLAVGDIVEIDDINELTDTDNAEAGAHYEWIGAVDGTDTDLRAQDYTDTDNWRRLLDVDVFGGEDPARARAYIVDSSIAASRDVVVEAVTEARAGADVSGASTSELNKTLAIPMTSFGASGQATGALLSGNKVSSQARAYIDNSGLNGGTLPNDPNVDAGGDVRVRALDTVADPTVTIDTATDDSNDDAELAYRDVVRIDDPSNLVNTGGVVPEGALFEFLGESLETMSLLDEDFADADRWRPLSASLEATMSLEVASATTNSLNALKGLATSLYGDGYDFTTRSGSQTLQEGDRVLLSQDFIDDNSLALDPGAYEYKGGGGLIDLGDATAAGYADSNEFERLSQQQFEDILFPNIGNLTDSNSIAAGGMVVMNDVRGAVEAYIKQSVVEAGGDVDVSASEAAGLRSDILSNVSSSGGSAFGTGTSLAINGQIATNLVLSSADAYILDSRVESGAADYLLSDADSDDRSVAAGDVVGIDDPSAFTGSGAGTEGARYAWLGTADEGANLDLTDEDFNNTDRWRLLDGAGDLAVAADNTSGVDATLKASTQTGDTGVGITLAFNTIGWQPQNVLFNAVDALLGDPLISEAFDGEDPARTHAYILNSDIDAGGDVDVSADNAAQLNATVSNAAESAASALFGATGQAFGGILASNKVSTSSRAYIDYEAGHGVATEVDAGGGVSIIAEDNAGILANSKMVSSSITTNDGGASVLQETINDLVDVDYDTGNPTLEPVALEYGDRVRLADDFDGDGRPGGVYVYLGTDTAGQGTDLRGENYENLDLWKETPETNLVPQGNNVTASDSVAVGGIVVVNDVRAGVAAFINQAPVTAGNGNIGVKATENATIHATTDSSSSSSGGSAYGTGDSIAVNGTIATNVVQSSAEAYLRDADIDARDGDDSGDDGHVLVDAANTSVLDAVTKQATTTGDTGASVILAFNTIGWESQNVLFNGIDALLGTPIGNENPARVAAFIQDTGVTAAGDIGVTAINEARLTAEIGNDTTAAASAMIGASATSVSGILAANRVSGAAEAFIDNSGAPTAVIEAGGSVHLLAADEARIDAFTQMQSPTSSVNDAGIGLLNSLLDTLRDNYQFTTSSGMQSVRFGDKVLVDEFQPEDYDYEAGVDDPEIIERGDVVKVAPGEVYQYTGALNLYDPDLTALDYGGDAWQRQHVIYEYMGGQDFDYADIDSPGTITAGDLVGVQTDEGLRVYEYIGAGDLTSPDLDATVQGYAASRVWQEVLPPEIDLDGQTYTDSDLWKRITQENIIPGAIAPTLLKATGIAGATGGSTALSGLAARNDVRSDVNAYIFDAEVTAHDGDVAVTALEEAEIKARDRSVVTATTGEAGAAVIVNNLVLSNADAWIEDSTVTAMGGDVQVDAHNRSIIDAVARGSVSGVDTMGATLAFNTIGWQAQDLLTQGIDALIGAPHIAEADDPAFTLSSADTATLQDLAAGDIVALDDITSTTGLGSAFDGVEGGHYEWRGTVDGAGIDLRNEDYTDTGRWHKIPDVDVFGGEQPAGAQAYIVDSTVTAGKDVVVEAVTEARAGADVSGASTSELNKTLAIPMTSFGANGHASGALLSGNKVSSQARAWIDNSGLNGGTLPSDPNVDAGGDVRVRALDTVADPTVTIDEDTATGDEATVGYRDVVQVANADNLTGANGDVPDGALFEFLGENPENIDLLTEDYADDDRWRPLAASLEATMSLEVLSSSTNNLNGLKDLATNLYDDGYDFTTQSGTQVLSKAGELNADPTSLAEGELLEAGHRVLVSQDFINNNATLSGYDTGIYRYVGDGETLDLADASIYADASKFEPITKQQFEDILFPNIGNLTDSNSIAAGGMVVMNDVRGAVEAYIKQSVVEAGGDVDVSASEAAGLRSDILSNVSSSGGSAFGTGTSLAINGQIATNLVLSSADAYILDSRVESGAADYLLSDADSDDRSVAAGDVVGIDDPSAFTGSGAGTEGARYAWLGTADEGANLDLTDEDFNNTDRWRLLDGAGDLAVAADNTSGVDATLKASTQTGDTGVGITLAFNTIGWQPQNVLFNAVDALLGDPLISEAFDGEDPARTHAYILNSDIDAGGDVDVSADNAAQLNATVSNAAESAASALFGATGQAFGGILASNKVSTSSRAYVDYEAGHGVATEVDAGGGVSITAEDNAGILANSKMVSSSITTNDGGASVLQETINDLVDVDYDTGNPTLEPVALEYGDRVRLADDFDGNGSPGSVYIYLGEDATPGNTTDLANANYNDLDFWKEAPETNLIPQGNNVTASDSIAVGALIVVNDVRADVAAFVNQAPVTANHGNVSVKATENAVLKATADSSATSSGGSAFGTGNSIAVSGVVATNLVQSAAQAWIRDSDITAVDPDDTDADDIGDVVVDASNTSSIDAVNTSAVESGDKAVGVVLAFNSIGWKAQNILFNTLDAVLGDPLISDAFDGANPAAVEAFIENSTVSADEDLTVEAAASSQLTATLSNDATSAAKALTGAEGASFGAAIASNKVNSAAGRLDRQQRPGPGPDHP